MNAGLEIDIKSGARGIFGAALHRLDFRMGAAEFFVEAFSDDAALFDKNGSDKRIRVHPALAALGQIQRQLHEEFIVILYFLHSVFAIRSKIPFTNFEESASP